MEVGVIKGGSRGLSTIKMGSLAM